MALPDARFFKTLQPISVADLAGRVGGEIVRGGEYIISHVAPLASAGPQAITFLSDRKLLAVLSETRADCVIVPRTAVSLVPERCGVIISAEAQAVWAGACGLLHVPLRIDSQEPVLQACEDDSVILEPGVVLGPGVRIGRGTRIGANTVIGAGVQIGRNCQIGANVAISCALIGDRVKLYAGARIGEAGFGAAFSSAGPVDVPQLGRVIVQDGVTVGANTCIDRGAYDDTVIGENSKIDNLVMIAHNCVIGRNNLMAAHTGISGSVTTGDNVMFGGQAGVGDHIRIGEGARVAGGAGVLADIPAGETWSGYPAKPIRQSLREAVWLAKQVSARTRQ